MIYNSGKLKEYQTWGISRVPRLLSGLSSSSTMHPSYHSIVTLKSIRENIYSAIADQVSHIAASRSITTIFTWWVPSGAQCQTLSSIFAHCGRPKLHDLSNFSFYWYDQVPRSRKPYLAYLRSSSPSPVHRVYVGKSMLYVTRMERKADAYSTEYENE
jgi:hypothetical protein